MRFYTSPSMLTKLLLSHHVIRAPTLQFLGEKLHITKDKVTSRILMLPKNVVCELSISFCSFQQLPKTPTISLDNIINDLLMISLEK